MSTETAENVTKEPTSGAQGVAVAPEKPSAKKSASRKKGAPKAEGSAKVSKSAPAKAKKSAKKPAKASKPAEAQAQGVRDGSKAARILNLLRRAKGATLAELMEASSWQAHSVRGFISGTLGKKMGLTVSPEKREDGTRVYSLAN